MFTDFRVEGRERERERETSICCPPMCSNPGSNLQPFAVQDGAPVSIAFLNRLLLRELLCANHFTAMISCPHDNPMRELSSPFRTWGNWRGHVTCTKTQGPRAENWLGWVSVQLPSLGALYSHRRTPCGLPVATGMFCSIHTVFLKKISWLTAHFNVGISCQHLPMGSVT